jgi:hypothetical protein
VATHDIVRRAIQRGLVVFGGASSLDGTPCGNVAISRNVDLFAGVMDQANDNHVVRADIARIEKTYTPKVGQVLVHPTEGTFKLTRLFEDDGYTRQYVVVQVPV